jgi:hypothetical protein
MKKPFAILLLASVLCVPQGKSHSGPTDAPRGVLGIEWGEGVETAKAKMLKRPGVVFDTAIVEPNHQRLLFALGVFLDEQVDTWNLEFYNNRFCWMKVILDSENSSDVEAVLEMKYGAPVVSTADVKEWQFSDATVRFVANSPLGHTSIVFWNNKLFSSKNQQDEKRNKIKLLDRLRDLD